MQRNTTSTVMDRLLRRIKHLDNGCWQWSGSIDPRGYGRISAGTATGHQSLYVHRVAYEQFKGAIPPDCEIDHLCRNRACCNPDHLEAVTHSENCLRGGNSALRHLSKHKPRKPNRNPHPRKRTPRPKLYTVIMTCSNGHNLTNPKNVSTDADGRPVCRRCRYERLWAAKRQLRGLRREGE